MKILVVNEENLDAVPPCINVCRALLDLGHYVTLITYGADAAPEDMSKCESLDIIDLGFRTHSNRLIIDFKTRSFLRKFCQKNIGCYDYVWTMSDLSARDCGPSLFETKHVMHLLELAYFVPAFSRKDLFLHSELTVKLARNAHKVVVPEINRSYIQQAWWKLPVRPVVLPNKPYRCPSTSSTGIQMVDDMFASEKRKILLYQGVFSADRNFDSMAKAAKLLPDDYVLFLMGARTTSDFEKIELFDPSKKKIVAVPFVSAPNHLAVTSYGHIGLLPYVPCYGSKRQTELNALYCAPNKIWEYSRAGLPMIGSDVPGLSSLLPSNHMGLSVDMNNPQLIVEAVQQIEKHYQQYSESSKRFFNNMDMKKIVSSILN